MVDNESEECIFCSIASESLASHKIAENQDAIAVLEINPISRGHVIVIPKKHLTLSKDIPREISDISQKISENMMKGLSPKDIIVAKTSLFGHDAINLVPVYNEESINSKRHHASEEELDEVQKILTESGSKAKKSEKEKLPDVKESRIEKINPKTSWLPKRIP